MLGNCSVTAQLAHSQEGLSSVSEWVITIGDYSIREAGGPRQSRHCNILFRFTYVFGTLSYLSSIFILALKIISPVKTNRRKYYGWLTMVGSVKEIWTTWTCSSILQSSVTFHLMITIKILFGGGLEYFHRSLASRRRRRKWNPVPGGITGSHCHWGT
jgi:hypothetical protein